ncbi:fructose-bisphosphate aldolase class I [candidate division WWE3 bacterium]|jgi:fructose-bisphosphate aldolase class I|nr:fructose-bisphosphate aldolase class I [candidate division WWE3 bacterium]MBT7349292.1 fructose-bisphosphate aldolase class I [candidate division WWE3 bacterium]
MFNKELNNIAKQMMTSGKGILASDESTNSANKTLSKNDIEPIEENRRRYRELFIGTKGIGKYLNGIILFDETIRQRDSEGKPFREILKEEGILIGIKVDRGTVDLPGFPGEKYTTGLDNLGKRLKEYYDMGARFAKWRSVIKIGTDLPSQEVLDVNAQGLALYASTCQAEGIVPIIEPEVLLDGNHSMDAAYEVTAKTLKTVFKALEKYKVDLKGVILKTSMVLPGKDSSEEKLDEEVAKATVKCLKEAVPNDIPGVVFLSGGQSAEDATHHLNEIAKLEPLPWEITFSFLRAIEGPPTEVWAGKDENVKKARVLFEQKLIDDTQAELGQLEEEIQLKAEA